MGGMERDLLGVIGKETGAVGKETCRQDEAFVGGFTVQRPSMSFMTAWEGEPGETRFEGDQRSSLLLAPQKSFSIHNRQNSVHGYRPRIPNCFGASSRYLNAAGSSFLKFHASPCPPNAAIKSLKQQHFGAFPPSDVSKITPKTAQLTIFYAGTANVFDNVPVDKADEIMLSASKASRKIATGVCPRLNSAIATPSKVADSDGLDLNRPPTPKQDHVTPPFSRLSSPVSVASQTGTLSRSSSSSNNTESASTTQNKAPPALPSASVMARAVPQARKASLARFMEKRKERVAKAVPYAKQPTDTGDAVEGGNVHSKSSSSSSVVVDLSNENCEGRLSLCQPKSSNQSGETIHKY